jgi:hypothetical protein
MFNLIPDSLRATIRSEYRLRLSIVAIVFIVIAEVIFLVFILPSWMVSYYREQDAISDTQKVNDAESNTADAPVQPTIKALNIKMGIVDTALEYPKMMPFIDGVLSRKTSSILINQFLYTATTGKTGTLTIDGVSATRESLVSFQKTLVDSGLFKKIDLPISNFAKNKNIPFTLSTTIELK